MLRDDACTQGEVRAERVERGGKQTRLGVGRVSDDDVEWAGRGVSMGQAPLEVQEAADDVTETVDEDGVAVELARWF